MAKKIWIAIGDIHNHAENFSRIPELKQASGIIISGDLTVEGGANKADKVLNVIREASLPILAQVGNMDLPEVDAFLNDNRINLHTHLYELTPDTAIFGIGGSTPTPMSTPTEFEESKYEEWLAELGSQAKKYPNRVLVSHNPPKNTKCDDLGNNAHVGSTAVRDFIEKEQPDVCICGHIHEGRAVDRIGKTVIINPGMLADGGYIVLSEDGGQVTAELKEVN